MILTGLVSGMPAPQITNNCKRRWGDYHKTWSQPKPVPTSQQQGQVPAPGPANPVVVITTVVPQGPAVPSPARPPVATDIPPPAVNSKSVAPAAPAPKPSLAAPGPPPPKPSAPSPAAPSPPAPVPAPQTGNGNQSPVGLGVDYLSNARASSFGSAVSWYHSWTTQTWPGMEGLEFVPTIKNRAMVQAFQAGQLGSAKYALSLNERESASVSISVSSDRLADIPSQHDGKKIPEADAAALHNQWTQKVPQGVQIGAVSVARGGKGYFDNWKRACGASCRYDFIPIHFYGLTTQEFISYAKVSSFVGSKLIRRNLQVRVNPFG